MDCIWRKKGNNARMNTLKQGVRRAGRAKKMGGNMSLRPRPLSSSEENLAASCLWGRSSARQAGSERVRQKLSPSERVRIAGMVDTLERYVLSHKPRDAGFVPRDAGEGWGDWLGSAGSYLYNRASDIGTSAANAASNFGANVGAAASYFSPSVVPLPWYSRAASWITEAATPVTAFLTSSAGMYSLGAAGLAALAVYYLRRTSSAAARENRKAKPLRDAANELSTFVNYMQRFIALQPAAASDIQTYVDEVQEFLNTTAATLYARDANGNFLWADDSEPPGAPEILARILALRTKGSAMELKLKGSIAPNAPPFAPNSSPFGTASPFSKPGPSPFSLTPSPFSLSPSASAPWDVSPSSRAPAPWDVSPPSRAPAPWDVSPPLRAPAPWESKPQAWPSPSLPSYSQFTSAPSQVPWLSVAPSAPYVPTVPSPFVNFGPSPFGSSPFGSRAPFASSPFATSPFASSPFTAPSYNSPAPFAMGAWPINPSVQDPPGLDSFAF